MSLANLLQLIQNPPSAPAPQDGASLSSMVPQGSSAPPAGRADINMLYQQPKPAPVPFLNPPAGTSVASPNGPTAQAGIANATNPTTPQVQPTPPVPGAGISKVGDMTPEMSDISNRIKGTLTDLKGYIANSDAQRTAMQKNIGDMQSQMLNSPTPSLQKVQLNPMQLLATLATSGALQNRFTPQSEQFTGNLLSGLANNNQTDFKNQETAHQNKMQVLQSAVQALRDETMFNRAADPAAMRAIAQELGSQMNNATRLADNQNSVQGRFAGQQITSQAKQDVANTVANSQTLRQAYDLLQHARGPAERVNAIRNIQALDPKSFAGMSDTDIESLLQLTPQEKAQQAKAGLDQVKAQTLPDSLLAQEAANNAKGKLALAQIDRVAHQNGWDDARSEEAQQHAALLYKITGNYDADHAADRALNLSKEYKNRQDVAQAITNGDEKGWSDGIKAANQIYNDQIGHAISQQKALILANGGQPFSQGDTSPSATAYQNLQHEIEGANTNLRALAPVARDPSQPLTPFQKQAFDHMYGGYLGRTVGDAATANAPAIPTPYAGQASPNLSVQIKPGGKPGQPMAVDVSGAIGAAPFKYLGSMKPTDVVNGHPLASYISDANNVLAQTPPQNRDAIRNRIIARYKGIGITLQ